MIFTAYMDESDSHGPTPTLIMSGFIASARQWEIFEERFQGFQRDFGFKTFHAQAIRARDGEFANWTSQKRSTLIDELAEALRNQVLQGITVILPHDLYKSEYRSSPTPNGVILDSQYGVCFRLALYRLQYIVKAQGDRHQLRIVLEAGHRNANDALRIFREVRTDSEWYGRNILESLVIAKKSECPLLAVADLQAYISSRSESRLRDGMPGYYEMAKIPVPTAPPLQGIGEPVLMQFEPSAETLRDLKAQQQQIIDDRNNKWRAERDAKLAAGAQSSSRAQPA